ncbi:MAG: alpha/beta fold hydrolase [Candidatus Eisenbacteria bacterium]|nr:alpha/beta fold hydrolase [Candidatus Latescibacterota bacterium]MBD3302081.1 alpha/beta fold hydrolase [Candidatus Eisenbacteria bacterium]
MQNRENGGLAYDSTGEGRAVLLLHAFPLSRTMWDPQVEALAATHRALRFDAAGFGDSPPRDGPLTVDRIADDAVRLLDHLGIETTVVCGLSMGGYAALAFARRHPRRLEGLVLADTRAVPDTEEERRRRYALIEQVRERGPSAVLIAMMSKMVGTTTHRERAPLVARIRERILAASPEAIERALQGLAERPDAVPELAEIRVPTRVFCGTEDGITPMSEAEALVRAIPDARLIPIPRAGHLANLENPDRFNAELLRFLRELDASGPAGT